MKVVHHCIAAEGGPKMKPRIRSVLRGRVVLLLALAATVSGPLVAGAILDDTPVPLVTSQTNPGSVPMDATVDTWWRSGWGAEPYPVFNVNLPGVESPPEFLIGMLYRVDRSASTVVNTAVPAEYSWSPIGTGTDSALSLDLRAALALEASPAVLATGAVDPIEGLWLLHYKFRSTLAWDITQHDVQFGIDVTKPEAAGGLEVRAGAGAPALTDSEWVPSSRAHLTWGDGAYSDGQYDSLSGDAYYQVLLDDVAIIPDSATAPSRGRVYSVPGIPLPHSITIEEMPAGRHKLSLVVVDRATNSSLPSSIYFNSDPDTPTISLSVPPITGPAAQMIATVHDAGGVRRVDFKVNGVIIATKSEAPYNHTIPNLAVHGVGPYAFSATVTDMYGRTADASTSVAIDANVGFRVGIFAKVNGYSYNEPLGASTLRYFAGQMLDVSFSASSPVDAFIYTLSRSADTSPSLPSAPGDPTTSYLPGGTIDVPEPATTLDLAEWHALQTSSRVPMPGLCQPLEGLWYLSVRAVSAAEFPPVSGTYRRVPFVIDQTPPSAPTGLAPIAGTPGARQTTSRIDLKWNSPGTAGLLSYDALSGDAAYRVYLNGSLVAQIRPLPSLAFGYCSLEGLPSGVVNEVGVSVVDKAGNEGPVATLQVPVNTPTAGWVSGGIISRVTDSPDPFYPRIRNGYKDDSIVRFTLSRRAMVWLLVYNAAGERVRLVTGTWTGRGRRSLKWDGKLDDGQTVAPDGTYRMYVGADDARGNVYFSTAKATKLRSFIVKRLGRNRVRLIFK
jgi:hypothetical protein